MDGESVVDLEAAEREIVQQRAVLRVVVDPAALQLQQKTPDNVITHVTV